MSKAAAKLAKVRSDRDALFASGKFYEALQLYKTLFSRATVKKLWTEAHEIVVEGATALLAQKQASAGGELALLLIELFVKSKQPADTEQTSTVLNLCAAFPPAKEGHEAKVNFLKAAIKWSTTATSNHSGRPEFHLALARAYRALGDFPSAMQNYLRTGGANSQLVKLSESQSSMTDEATSEYVETCQTLLAWAQTGAPSELDLFVCRAVLQYLCLQELEFAREILTWFRSTQAALAAESLFHFLEFLVEIAPQGKEALQLFDVLRVKYAPALARDPALEPYLDRVGSLYFGRQQQQGFMESLLSGLGGGAAPAAASPSPTAASAAAPTPAAVAAPAAAPVRAAPAAISPAAAQDDPMQYAGPDVD